VSSNAEQLQAYTDEHLRAAMAYMGTAAAPAPIRAALREKGVAMHPWPYTGGFELQPGDDVDSRCRELEEAACLIRMHVNCIRAQAQLTKRDEGMRA
jgi:hypothetical protein